MCSMECLKTGGAEGGGYDNAFTHANHVIDYTEASHHCPVCLNGCRD